QRWRRQGYRLLIKMEPAASVSVAVGRQAAEVRRRVGRVSAAPRAAAARDGDERAARLIRFFATPAAPAQVPGSAPFADTELDAALETLTQYSIERIIKRVISLEAAELLARLRSMSEELSRAELKDQKEQMTQLQQKGLIAVTYRKGKRVSIQLQRERII